MKGSRSGSKILPIASQIFPVLVNLYCLLIYFTAVTEKNLLDFGYVAYLTLLANGLIGVTKFFNEETFCDLRILLDYAQVVLPHPFLTTQLWLKLSVGPTEIACVHVLFSLVAFLFFAFMEYKRQDLADLALIVSITSSVAVGILYLNYFAIGAGFLMAGAYFTLKRSDDCELKPSQTKNNFFNLVMCAYSLLTLAQFGPSNWIPEIPGLSGGD